MRGNFPTAALPEWIHSGRWNLWLRRPGRSSRRSGEGVRAKGSVNAILVDNTGDIGVAGQADCEGALSEYSTSGQTLWDRRLSAQNPGTAAFYFAAVDSQDNIWYRAGGPARRWRPRLSGSMGRLCAELGLLVVTLEGKDVGVLGAGREGSREQDCR